VADCVVGVVQIDDCCYQSRCFLLTHPHVTEVVSLTGHNLKRCGTGMQLLSMVLRQALFFCITWTVTGTVACTHSRHNVRSYYTVHVVYMVPIVRIG